jgi:sugar lactone lactonase YvrE
MPPMLIRVAEGGSILQELRVEGIGVFACMLGGDDGRTLFACAAPTFREAEAFMNHGASILVTRVEVPHAGLLEMRRGDQFLRRGPHPGVSIGEFG